MPAAKDAPPGKITIHMDNEMLAEIDHHRQAAVANAPGARLSRAAWGLNVLRNHLAELRQGPAQEPQIKGKKR